MKKSLKTPVEKFNYLLKASESVKISAIMLMVLSGILIYQMRAQVTYIIPLALGIVVLIAYTVNNLWLKNYTIDEKNIQLQLKRYKLYLAKRQKYEAGIVFIWILTVTPSYLYGKDIDLFLLLGFMVFTYLFIVLGNFLFQKIKNEVKEIESQVNHLATTETSLI
tara:strand:- start:2129 stop:2623 length:495 start_codon:yes stop_codon:yes gene_type:complete